MRKHIIKIYRCSDYYNNFYKEYIVNTLLEEHYHGNIFLFNIYFDKDDEMDEQLLFEYYLIASKYGEYALFDLRCHLSQNRSSSMENYYRLSTYGFDKGIWEIQ